MDPIVEIRALASPPILVEYTQPRLGSNDVHCVRVLHG